MLIAAARSYALTGIDINLIYTPVGAYILTCAVGNFALTGINLTALKAARRLTALKQEYILSGKPINLVYSSGGLSAALLAAILEED
jgi:hypothetical protein